jgi:FAD/FMN-containing dehydrogenase
MLRAYPLWRAHDVSLPIGRIAEFLEKARRIVDVDFPQLSELVFGHVGDGNIHYNFVAANSMEPEHFDNMAALAKVALYTLVCELEGSISAEHGIGVEKKGALERFATPAQLRLMRTVKQTLDPADIMNPGKVLRSARESPALGKMSLLEGGYLDR